MIGTLNTGERLAFVNGCFDVLHYGHLKLLSYAKSSADKLIVAIDSDTRVKESKGPNRPYNDQEVRKFFLESLVYVDKVEIFNSEQELEQIVKRLSPDIMIVGSEYKERHVVGSQYAKSLEFFGKINGYSTTKILQHAGDR